MKLMVFIFISKFPNILGLRYLKKVVDTQP